MSKKTRKNSSKPTVAAAAVKATGANRRSTTAAAKAKTVKTGTANKTAKAGTAAARKPGKPVKSASAKASHKAASKPLRPDRSASVKSAGLAEGAAAPAFRLFRDGGASVSLSDYTGRKLVLFFYPRADTPGCTKEAIDFTRLKDAFAASGTELLGVSADSIKAQESFRNKHQLRIPLGSDEQHEMLEAYGAWGEKSMYGRTFLGIIRTTVLIGADGRIARIWRNVRVDGHADEVLAAARTL